MEDELIDGHSVLNVSVNPSLILVVYVNGNEVKTLTDKNITWTTTFFILTDLNHPLLKTTWWWIEHSCLLHCDPSKVSWHVL